MTAENVKYGQRKCNIYLYFTKRISARQELSIPLEFVSVQVIRGTHLKLKSRRISFVLFYILSCHIIWKFFIECVCILYNFSTCTTEILQAVDASMWKIRTHIINTMVAKYLRRKQLETPAHMWYCLSVASAPEGLIQKALNKLSSILERNLCVKWLQQKSCAILGWGWGGGGSITDPLVNFSISKIFDLTNVLLRVFQSHLYLTGATAAELRLHLSNINVIANS